MVIIIIIIIIIIIVDIIRCYLVATHCHDQLLYFHLA